MDMFAPRIHDLPTEFPVFPLSGALLLPGGKLPLNIFEPRYLALIEDALGAGRIFAMIQPDLVAAPGPNGPKLFRVGCLGRLSSFSESDDGQRYLITLHGLARFAVAGELATKRGYRCIRGDFSEFQADIVGPPATASFDREGLLDALRAYFRHRRIDANWDAIGQIADDDLVTTLSMVCPFDPMEKQALLEAETPSARAGILLALFRIDTHSVQDGGSGHPLAS